MSSYKMILHRCEKKITPIQNDMDIWQIYTAIPMNNSQGESNLQLWVHFSNDSTDEHGVYINFCPFCGYQPERLSEKTSKDDAIV